LIYSHSVFNCLTILFKANISLGGGPVEDSTIFFNAPQRTVFGACCYFQKGAKTYKVFFTILSESTLHDSRTVTEMVKKNIISHPLFTSDYFGIKKLSFWMDNAPNHFRTFETVGLFSDLSTNFQVSFNYFAEYHGKSECDRHFGLMSRCYTDYCTRSDSKDINTTEDYIFMYESHIREANGLILRNNFGFFEELKAGTKETDGLNVCVSKFMLGDEEHKIQEKIEESRNTLNRKELEEKAKEGIPYPYSKPILKVEPNSEGKFVLNDWYSFEILSGTSCPKISCHLSDKSPRSHGRTYSYSVYFQVNRKYKIKFASSKSADESSKNILKRTQGRIDRHYMRIDVS
jgi:hypothetical protein